MDTKESKKQIIGVKNYMKNASAYERLTRIFGISIILYFQFLMICNNNNDRGRLLDKSQFTETTQF